MLKTLKTQADYKAAFKGKRKSDKNFTVVVSNSVEPRYGVITPKKVGVAVKRNSIKRKLREVILTEVLPALPGKTVLVMVNGPVHELSYTEVQESVKRLAGVK